MKRKAQIAYHLEALEALYLHDASRFESWHGTFLKMCRRRFDQTDDLDDSQFETLEKIRHRIDPPKLGAAKEPAGKPSNYYYTD